MQPTIGWSSGSEYEEWVRAKVPVTFVRNGQEARFRTTTTPFRGRVSSTGFPSIPRNAVTTSGRLVVWNQYGVDTDEPYFNGLCMETSSPDVVLTHASASDGWAFKSNPLGNSVAELKLTKFYKTNSAEVFGFEDDHIGSIIGDSETDNVALFLNADHAGRFMSVDVAAAFRIYSEYTYVEGLDVYIGQYSTEGELPSNSQEFWNGEIESMPVYEDNDIGRKFSYSNEFRDSRGYRNVWIRKKFIDVPNLKMFTAISSPIVKLHISGLDYPKQIAVEMQSLYVCIQRMD